MMITRCFLFACFVLSAVPALTAVAASSVGVSGLRCEYLRDPLGIDVPHPRLSWELVSTDKGKKQTAYRIMVATDSLALTQERADAWDTRKVVGNSASQIAYNGKPLLANTLYFWRVCSWDEKGAQSAWSPVARFFVGPLSSGDWKAQWIGEVEYPVHADDIYYPFSGFFCLPASEADARRTLTIDLGEAQRFDAVRLWPAFRRENIFPLRFSVEVSSSPDFAASRTIVDETAGDVAVHPAEFYFKQLDAPVAARYVRLNVARMAALDRNSYGYGLAEFEVLRDRENIALNRPVTASETRFYASGWQDRQPADPQLVADGHVRVNNKYFVYDTKIPPSPLLRKEITIAKKVRRAFFSASALGIYEACLNGEKIGRQVFAPEFTSYDKHLQYQTYDVGGQLRQGVNVLGATLADGWYAGPHHLTPGRGNFGYARRFLGQLLVFYEDGSSEVFATDGSWKMQQQGPVTEAFFFTGEIYDARNEWKGWGRAGFDDSGWSAPAAYPLGTVAGKLCAQMNEPVEVIRELPPVSVRKSGRDRYIFDMGQNMVGWCRLTLPYNPKQPVRMRYGEMLYEDGTLYTDNLRDARPVDVYRPGDEATIDYEPRFTYHGFRYVEVEGLAREPQTDWIKGKVVASASPETGTFECSDRDVNRLWENIRWTQWGNLVSIPTDCPQRDERLGWMADAQIFSQTAIFNLDMAAFYTKWARDMRDSQWDEGPFTDMSPYVGIWKAFSNSPGWSDAGVIIPWQLYRNYGDVTILAAQYEAMKRYVNFIDRTNPDHIWRNNKGGFGDWLNGDSVDAEDYPNRGNGVPEYLFSTAYFAFSTDVLTKTATLLGKRDDARHYGDLNAAIRKAFVENFVKPDGRIEGDNQAGYAMTLQMGLIPENLRAKAAARMAEIVEAYGFRMSTGIHTTIWLMKQLCEYGYSDVAYRLLLSRRFPSWMYSLDQGATTIWERWDGYVAGRGFQDPVGNSFNHVAFGAVGEWMYSYILGIRPDDSSPGFRHFFVKPQPGGGLEWAKGSYRSIAGTIEAAWTRKDGLFTLEVTVPANTEATVVMPDGKGRRVGSGRHGFSIKI
ncbi:MAG: family 78 glycoside hydrolase catalytic domain [Rikenellaceae bacterium]|jgi:alpha-L-rhamnosidase|nr:family 78 glycoside hydrolase catalytic domain [Rikenellaceae bacterium]